MTGWGGEGHGASMAPVVTAESAANFVRRS
jgi:hypothetical protein